MDQSLMTIPPASSTGGLPFRVLTPDAAIKMVGIFADENSTGFRAKIVAVLQRFKAGCPSVLTDEPYVWAISDEDNTAQDRDAPAPAYASVVASAGGLGAAAQAATPSSSAGPGAARSCSMNLDKAFQEAGSAAKAGVAAAAATAATLITNHYLQVKRSIYIANQPIRVTEDNLVIAEDVVVAIHGGEPRHASLVRMLVLVAACNNSGR